MKTATAPTGANSPIATPTVRPLRSGEEAEAASVFQEAVLGNWCQPKPPLWATDDDRHAEHRLATDDLRRMHAEAADLVLVAEHEGEIIGMAATTIRDQHAHIVFLFVLPEHQNRGVGRALLDDTLDAIHRHGAPLISLTASDDRRAWTRYLRAGLIPGAPIVSFAADVPRPPASIEDGLAETRVDAANAAQLDALDALDRAIKGAARRRDRLAWLAEGAHEALVHDPAAPAAPVGAYVVSVDHDHCRIGPILASDPVQVEPILRRALVTAATLCGDRPVPWRVDVPATSRVAIPMLLEAGFRPRNLLPWFANAPIGQWDRYILRNEDLL